MQETDFIFRKLSPICIRVHLTAQRPWDRFSDILRGSSGRDPEGKWWVFLPIPYQFVALSYTIWVMPSPMKTAPGWTKYFQTITSSLVSVATISQPIADAELRGRENGKSLEM